MIVAESLCCGTPVVGFKAGGPESIAIDDYCVFVQFLDSISCSYFPSVSVLFTGFMV
jgi:glycosyltransferase involved in cell wall biosynthesis